MTICEKRTDQEIRSIAIAMLNISRYGQEQRAIAVVTKPTTSGYPEIHEVAPGGSLVGRGADVIVVGDMETYGYAFLGEDHFEEWKRSVLRCRLNPGGIFVELN